MTLANIITFSRILLVPLILWALLSNAMVEAFALFMLAGFSDALDGALARWMDQKTELGTVLDPLADKAMLVSLFVTLAALGHLPLWLVILVVSRDILIVFGVGLAVMLDRPVTIDPLPVSKATTFAQILLVAFVLGELAFPLTYPALATTLEWLAGSFTAFSAIAYIAKGFRHFSTEPVERVARRNGTQLR